MRNLILIMGLLFCFNGFSQANSKNDIIMTVSGELLQVKVTKVTEGAISFNYPGESVVNEISTKGVEKIVFASGRTQNFKGTATENPLAGTVVEETSVPKDIFIAPSFEKNSVAIVPADFNRNGAYDKALSSNATAFVVNLLSGKTNTTGIDVLPMSEAVEKLIDAGVNYGQLRQSSPEALRKVLGTEYLLYVSINENETGSDAASNSVNNVVADNAQMERLISIRLFNADSPEECFKIDFTEDLFMKKTGVNSGTLLAGGKWKSSLRYLSEQLFASKTFSAQ